MQNLFSQFEGVIFLFLYGLVMIIVSLISSYYKRKDKEEFLLANREIKPMRGAMSIAASWIWAPALFISSQKAYEQGLAGAFWFIVPNFVALLFFAPFALKVRKILPAGYTLPQYIKYKHGTKVHILYLIQFFGLQICSFAVQILAGATLIKMVTGLPFFLISVILVSIVLIYSLIGGFRASVATDFLQMALILAICFIITPWVILKAGGVSTILAGFGGVSGKFTNVFDPWVFYSFGIPTTIGLLAGPLGDQMHWQRAYALKSNKDVIKTFFGAGFIFILVPLCLSLLGFIAANKVNDFGWIVNNTQMVGAITVSNLLPSFMLIAFVIMLLSGLFSTLDSILSAMSSLVTVDLLNLKNFEFNHKKNIVKIARISMFVTSVLGLSIALIPGIKILHLFLFYGTLRASTLIPTILTILWPNLKSKAVFYAILLSLIFGAPLMAIGTLINNVHLSVIGSLLVLVLGLSISILFSKLENLKVRKYSEFQDS